MARRRVTPRANDLVMASNVRLTTPVLLLATLCGISPLIR